jgi:LemA protein
MRMDWIIAAVVVGCALYAVYVYNRLVRNRNLVAEGWSGIDVQLRRRADLVPNLVETVKAYARHEAGVLQDVVTARTAGVSATGVSGQAAAAGALQAALGRLFVLAEAYPDLKADKNFLTLQSQLAEIEDQLQMARRYYNGAARDFNILLQSFPEVMIANLFGFKPAQFFEVEDAASRAAPQVTFGTKAS